MNAWNLYQTGKEISEHCKQRIENLRSFLGTYICTCAYSIKMPEDTETETKLSDQDGDCLRD
jgi:hypothetical protein